MKQNTGITKQLYVCVAVYELLTALLALELALPEEEMPKHMHLTQSQFKVFKNVTCFMSVCRHHLDKAWRCCFAIVLCNVRREIWAVACSKPPTLETCSGRF